MMIFFTQKIPEKPVRLSDYNQIVRPAHYRAASRLFWNHFHNAELTSLSFYKPVLYKREKQKKHVDVLRDQARYHFHFLIKISGYLRLSHTGGVAVEVHIMTFKSYLAAKATALSNQAKSYFPSSGSNCAQANSAKWVNSKPKSCICLKSLSH